MNDSHKKPAFSFLMFCLVSIGLTIPAHHSTAENSDPEITPEAALILLKNGNKRFVNGERLFQHISKERVKEAADGQNPFATLITCSDSRVPPEHIFDMGIGDIFVIRVAGNVCDTDEIGSIEYGVDNLATPLLVVMGHTDCGAVSAVLKEKEVHGSIPKLIDNIIPAVNRVKKEYPHQGKDELINKAVQENVWQSINDLFKTSPIIREKVKLGALKVIGAVYHIQTGEVEWLGSHPQQEKLIKQSQNNSKNQLFHVVYFWLKEGASEEQRNQLINDCKDYLGSIETVKSIKVGIPANTPERDVVDHSFGVGLIIEFDGIEGHNIYQKHRKHQEFIERNKAIWEKVQVYDMVEQ